MKTRKLAAVIAAALLTGVAAYADSLNPTMATNAKGQPLYLFRCDDTAPAVYSGGGGIGPTNDNRTLKPAAPYFIKGQFTVLYWAE